MKFILLTILIGTASYFAEQFLPWWSVVPVSFLAGLSIYTRSLNAFLAGFLGVGLLWFFFALNIDIRTNSILTEKIADIFNLGRSLLLVVMSGLIGGLVSGFGSLSGNQLLKMFSKRDMPSKYR